MLVPVPLRKFRSKRQGRGGVAATEFALLAPFIVFLAVGAIEMGRGLQVKEVLSEAARKGCRTAIGPLASDATVTGDINSVLTDNNITPSDASITIQVNGKTVNCSTAKEYDKISVQVSIQASKIAWVTPLFLPSATLESGTVTMMRQR